MNYSKVELKMTEMNEKEFDDQVIKFSKDFPVVANYFTTWCGPCRILNPILAEKLKTITDFDLRFVEIDMEKFADVGHDQGVEAIPHVILYYKGKKQPKASFVGLQSDEILNEFILNIRKVKLEEDGKKD